VFPTGLMVFPFELVEQERAYRVVKWCSTPSGKIPRIVQRAVEIRDQPSRLSRGASSFIIAA